MAYLKAYLVSLGVFALLSIGFFVFWPQIRIDTAHVEVYLFGALVLSIVLIAVNVLQLYKNAEDATHIATHLLKDMLTSSQELFFELYRSSPVPYLLVEKNGTITSINTSAVRLFDTQEGGLEGKNIFDFIEGDDVQHVALFSEKLAHGLFINDEEVRIIRADASSRWVLCSFFSFMDGQNIRRGLVTLVDISKQKQIDQAKTEFVSLASHQLRTPIATMKWNLELLLMKYGAELSVPVRAYITKFAESLEQMNMLVGDFLNASRFELGTLKFKKETLDVRVALEGVIVEQRAFAEAKGVSVAVQYVEGLSSIASDPQLFHMIANNLISNAVKYTPAGGAVTVTLQRSANGNGIEIQVTDTGMGIPKSEQGRLFTKIFRASNALALVPDGTGLGLYIASQAAKVLGGEIRCVSEENVGTTFTVILP